MRGQGRAVVAMTRIRIRVLGPVQLEVDGAEVRLTPLTTRLLVRLVAAEGEAVPVRTLRRDVWGMADEPRHLAQRGRNEVQKRVLELRRALDPRQDGTAARVLRTEHVTVAGPETAYRLVPGPGEVDSEEFTAVVGAALLAPPATAAHRLGEALDMVRGRPLAEVHGEEFAAPYIRRLAALQDSARRELVSARTRLGRPDLALPVAESIARDHPDDREAARTLDALRAELRARHGDELLRHAVPLPGRRVDVVLLRGDLFEQQDANLVVGFTDTFDTASDGGAVIDGTSVQAQLLLRRYGGDVRRLDAALDTALGGIEPLARESRAGKPLGKLDRYPLGTVAVLGARPQLTFATAYSRIGNDLLAASSVEDLWFSLNRLWDTVSRHARPEAVAMPLVGSGLSRLDHLDQESLLRLILMSFVARSREGAICRELRVVVRPADLARINMPEVAAFLRTLASGLDRG